MAYKCEINAFMEKKMHVTVTKANPQVKSTQSATVSVPKSRKGYGCGQRSKGRGEIQSPGNRGKRRKDGRRNRC